MYFFDLIDVLKRHATKADQMAHQVADKFEICIKNILRPEVG
jgi:hypothetical protein